MSLARFTPLNGVFILAFAELGFSAHQGPAVGTLVQSGLCSQHVTGRYSQPQSTAGYATIGPLSLTERTTEVPLRPGIGFGFLWKASNLPNPAMITYRVEHPPITRPDGRTMNRFEEELEVETSGGKYESIDCYALNEKYELVPGTWTLSVLFRGTLLAKQNFYVHEAEPQ